jgi:protein arginine kinase activator
MSVPCQLCGSPSTIHLTDIIKNKKREMHLCDSCARENQLISSSSQEINIPSLMHLIFGQLQGDVKSVSLDDALCPECGAPYAHFKAQGRLGCPHEYRAFREQLVPLLERIQNNHTRHVGKIPRRFGRVYFLARRAALESELRAAVEAEHYEAAARLRDEIRSMGEHHES